jgi:hypothetical protein
MDKMETTHAVTNNMECSHTASIRREFRNYGGPLDQQDESEVWDRNKQNRVKKSTKTSLSFRLKTTALSRGIGGDIRFKEPKFAPMSHGIHWT